MVQNRAVDWPMEETGPNYRMLNDLHFLSGWRELDKREIQTMRFQHMNAKKVLALSGQTAECHVLL